MSDKLKVMQVRKSAKQGRNRFNKTPDPSAIMLPWGVDVSHHQGVIDWQKVRNAGCQFAFIKATEGATFKDRQFRRNRDEAGKNGIITGAYHFFRAGTSLEAQMNNFAKTIGEVHSGELSPVIDVEIPSQWSRFSVSERNDMIVEFIEGIRERLGRNIDPFIYLSPSFADDVLKNDYRLAYSPLWLAHYTSRNSPRTPRPWSTWTFWQWTERGRVAGVDTYVDLNRFNGTMEDLLALTVGERFRSYSAS